MSTVPRRSSRASKKRQRLISQESHNRSQPQAELREFSPSPILSQGQDESQLEEFSPSPILSQGQAESQLEELSPLRRKSSRVSKKRHRLISESQ